jgi:hypothetical protein
MLVIGVDPTVFIALIHGALQLGVFRDFKIHCLLLNHLLEYANREVPNTVVVH